MSQDAVIPRRHAAGLMFGPLVALCLAPPAVAAVDEEAQERVTAEKVAKKVEKARTTKHQDKEEQEAIRHFKKEVAEYVALHDGQCARLGGPDSAAAQKGLAAAIVARRPKAKQGDIFLPEVQPLLRRLVGEQLKGPDTQAARKAVVEGNPTEEEDSVTVIPRINGVYPLGAPRSTVPASLLLALPPLPPCLHYRFVGRDLLLVDSLAQIVVDILPAAAPELSVK